jgi:hypothetical protein
VFRKLLGERLVHKTGGTGKKGDPFRYLGNAGSQNSALDEIAKKTREPEKPELAPRNSGLFDAEKMLVPEVPSTSWERESLEIPQTHVRTSSKRDPDIQVPEVPEHSQNAGNGTSGTRKAPDKHCSDSGSQLCETESEREKVAL